MLHNNSIALRPCSSKACKHMLNYKHINSPIDFCWISTFKNQGQTSDYMQKKAQCLNQQETTAEFIKIGTYDLVQENSHKTSISQWRGLHWLSEAWFLVASSVTYVHRQLHTCFTCILLYIQIQSLKDPHPTCLHAYLFIFAHTVACAQNKQEPRPWCQQIYILLVTAGLIETMRSWSSVRILKCLREGKLQRCIEFTCSKFKSLWPFSLIVKIWSRDLLNLAANPVSHQKCDLSSIINAWHITSSSKDHSSSAKV